ncbi:phage holin family protein [Marinivivus vitaminiproducens]|uniref:phage holin family protein n=1 Tax=Marinivivus vitaminiproducens TaxID=3035935 RepID=UPI0027A6A59F|nr:phage holin family protein [Geminicoccaceae bacterium SCSIO 64248]
MAISHSDQRGFPSLLSDLFNHLSTLVRKEVQLARVETSENINKAMGSIALIVGGLVFVVAGLTVLFNAVTILIIHYGVSPLWAPFIIAAGGLLVGAVLVLAGRSGLKAVSLAPTRTTSQLQQDVTAAREKVR